MIGKLVHVGPSSDFLPAISTVPAHKGAATALEVDVLPEVPVRYQQGRGVRVVVHCWLHLGPLAVAPLARPTELQEAVRARAGVAFNRPDRTRLFLLDDENFRPLDYPLHKNGICL